jgi:tetratricopeptide (TPR) repeat protein
MALVTNLMVKNIFLILIGFFLFFLAGCGSTGPNPGKMSPEQLTEAQDSLLAAHPDDPEMIRRLVDAHLKLAERTGRIEEYQQVLKLDPRNAEARYQIAMEKGKQLYQQGSHTALWDALVAFGKAATAIDSLGEPHYWMARSYLKKDDMDFDLILEAYDKALALYLPDSLRSEVEAERKTLLKRKDTYEKFWK